jgi:hypothetical protein
MNTLSHRLVQSRLRRQYPPAFLCMNWSRTIYSPRHHNLMWTAILCFSLLEITLRTVIYRIYVDTHAQFQFPQHQYMFLFPVPSNYCVLCNGIIPAGFFLMVIGCSGRSNAVSGSTPTSGACLRTSRPRRLPTSIDSVRSSHPPSPAWEFNIFSFVKVDK